ncbi:MAG TPA: cytochrome c [Verrucomicrobiae bacterium]|nr:cytochrome c [Verrucomicrobiae bacterium]
MKTQALVKTAVVAALFTGVFCWSATADDATDTWNANCAMCHGKDGKGDTLMGHRLQIKDLTDAKVQAALTDEQAAKIIKEGVTEDGRTKMKAFGGQLSDDQIKALVAKVRSFKAAQ